MNSLAMGLQNCCCENRAAVADLKYTMAQEAAATRANCDANKQAIMDKLCQLELDTVKQNYENKIATITANYDNRISGMQNTIDSLRTMNSDARFDASQNAQTAAIQSGQRTLANEIEQYVLPTAKPAYIVQNPNCCAPQTFGCGCAVA
jgi:phage-related protein